MAEKLFNNKPVGTEGKMKSNRKNAIPPPKPNITPPPQSKSIKEEKKKPLNFWGLGRKEHINVEIPNIDMLSDNPSQDLGTAIDTINEMKPFLKSYIQLLRKNLSHPNDLKDIKTINELIDRKIINN